MTEIDYGFRDGTLSYRSGSFDADGSHTEGEIETLPIVSAPTPEQAAALKAELGGATVKTIESPDGDGSVQTVLLNHEAPKENGLTVYGMGIGGNFKHPVGARDVSALAAANPDRRLLVMNNAGSERSSLIPREVMAEMKRTGSYVAKGEWLLHVLKRELEAYGDDIALWGNSAGGRVALGMAAAMSARGGRVDNVRVVDPPGAKNTTPLGVMWGFARQLGDQKSYRQSPYGGLEDVDEQTANLFTARGAFRDNMLGYPSVMSNADGFDGDLAAAMAAVRGDLSFIRPEHSQFGSHDEVAGAMGRAALLQPGDRRLYTVLDHSHTILSDGAGSRPMATLYEIPKRPIHS